MALSIEELASDLFKDVEKRKKPDCLGIDILGAYIERTSQVRNGTRSKATYGLVFSALTSL